MICIIALVVFSILGIFSAKYRIIAKEAFDCVFRRITFRKCTSGLDTRLKGQITGKLMKRAPKVGAWTFKNFELISWFFTILMIVSIAYSGYSAYNFIAYGNCNGKDSTEFCIFDPLGSRGQNASDQCSVTGDPLLQLDLKTPPIGDGAKIGDEDSEVRFVVIGCYTCSYTKQFDPTLNKLISNYNDSVLFVYKDFPIAKHQYSYDAAIAAQCADEQGRFWDYKTMLFENQDDLNNATFKIYAKEMDLDSQRFDKCFDNQETKSAVDSNIFDGLHAGVYGTPTVFINDKYLVGPKSYSRYKYEIVKQRIFSLFN